MNYYCKYIEPGFQSDWEKLVKANKASGFHQSFEWAKFKNGDGWNTYKIGLFNKETDELVGGTIVTQFCFSNKTDFFYIPEGPVINYENEKAMMEQWKVLFEALGEIIGVSDMSQTTHLRVEPRVGERPKFLDERFVKAPLNLQPKYTQVIDLADDEVAILAQMKPKGRYNIKLAEKKGVKIVGEEINAENIKAFFEIYDQTFSRKKLEKKDLPFFERLMGECKSIAKLYFAEYEGKKLATEFVIYYGNRATYLYGASLDESREVMAPYLMHWEVMKEAKKNGFKEYDLWGIATPGDEKHEWIGITDFKKKFGGREVALIGSYDLVIQKDLYEAFLKKHEL
jgi:lipid II:glycine glycyltransferase (peptidoglycan interpeptide bridge formation enzyme)